MQELLKCLMMNQAFCLKLQSSEGVRAPAFLWYFKCRFFFFSRQCWLTHPALNSPDESSFCFKLQRSEGVRAPAFSRQHWLTHPPFWSVAFVCLWICQRFRNRFFACKTGRYWLPVCVCSLVSLWFACNQSQWTLECGDEYWLHERRLRFCISMNIQKQGRKPVKKIYLFFTCSLNTLRPSQRSKGMCSDHNPGSIRLCDEMAIKRRKQAFWKKNG
jgi:hypothetical protein